MKTDRRTALKGLAMAASCVPGAAAAATLGKPLWRDTDWSRIATAFVQQKPLVNLNNAAVSPPAIVTQEAAIRAYRFANENPDVHMWNILDADMPKTKAALAKLADCDAGEIALVRNSTEGLCVAIFGIPLRAGDEVLLGDWDYASMRRAWDQRSRREGIVVAPVKFDLLDSDDAIVEAYRRAMTPRTKAMQLTHMIHWTGRVLPVERLCALARERGIRTVVDGAQSFAHVPLSFRQLGCDYFVTSLHKWLCAPLGNGMLIMRAGLIEETWPLFAPYEDRPMGMGKFDGPNSGTYSSPAQWAIQPAIEFYNQFGVDRAHARLRELTHHWVERASDIKGFRIHTPLAHPGTGAVSLFSIDGITKETIENRLREQYKFRVRWRSAFGLEGVRVSPHLYTSKSDLDRFVTALRHLVKTS